MALLELSAVFPDVSDLGRKAGFDLGFRRLDSGPDRVRADFRLGEQITLVRMTFARAYHQRGTPPEGMKSFGIPFSPMRNWLGNEYEEQSVLPFNLPDGIDGVSEAGFEACTISVREECLERVSEAFQVPVGDALVAPGTNTVIGNGRSTQLLRRLVSSHFKPDGGRLDLDHESELVLVLLHSATADTLTIDKSSPNSRAQAIARSIAFINERRGEAVTVAEICRATGIPLRTLNRAFREHFGVGPKGYLIRQRLSEVRAELIQARSGIVITDVANRWGFWHMGQFARDYRAVFGELPSATLASGRS